MQVVNIARKFLDHAKQSATDAFKTLQKEEFKKRHNKLVIWLVKKLPLGSQKFQKTQNGLIHRTMKKYLQEDIYLQEKDRKLLIN